MDYTGTSRGPPDATAGYFPTTAAGPSSNAGPGPSTAAHAVGHKAPAKRALGSGRGSGRGRGAPAKNGTSTGRLAAPLASSSVVGQRSTRSANRPRVASLKLRFSDKGEVQKVQGGQLTSFLGDYSREADTDDDEPLVFEEQFILRVPDRVVRGDKEKGIKGIKTLLEEKKEVNNASFKFKDTRRAVFTHGGTNYSAKLVDLPCIIESQKTLDRKRLFKCADISQMLVVDPDPIDPEDEDQVTRGPMEPRDYAWPHGLTPPLRHVRERRWRVHRQGDRVKAEVDRLLALDKKAYKSSFDLIELDTHLDEQDYDEPSQGYPYREGTADTDPDNHTPGTPWSQGEGADLEEGSMIGEGDDRTELGSEGGEGDMDMDLEAALNREEDEGATDEEDEDEEEGDDDDDEAEEEEEDEEIVELRSQQRLLEQEASALEEMVSKKTQEMQNVSAMIRMRIQRDVTKYQADLASKIKAKDENQSKIDSKVEAKDKAREVKEIEKEDDYDGLFGEDEEEEEDGQGEHGEEDDEDDEWDQIFANEEVTTSTPDNMSTPRDNDDDMGRENQHRGSSLANRGTVSLNSPEHHDEDDGEEEDDEDEDDEDEDAEGEDDDDTHDAMDIGAPAPFVPPIAHQAPVQTHAPATGGWGYVESDEDEDDD